MLVEIEDWCLHPVGAGLNWKLVLAFRGSNLIWVGSQIRRYVRSWSLLDILIRRGFSLYGFPQEKYVSLFIICDCVMNVFSLFPFLLQVYICQVKNDNRSFSIIFIITKTQKKKNIKKCKID